MIQLIGWIFKIILTVIILGTIGIINTLLALIFWEGKFINTTETVLDILWNKK